MEAHNSRRAKHWAPPLVWSDECYDSAQRMAAACMAEGKKLPRAFTMSISGNDHGQWVVGPRETPLPRKASSAEKITGLVYDDGAQKFKFGKSVLAPQKGTKNFTQIIWLGTTSVGMALSDDGAFCVANYAPAGGAEAAYWAFNRYVQQPQKFPAPWLPAGPPAPDGRPPCCEDDWRRHDHIAEALEAAHRKPLLDMHPELKKLLEEA